MIDRAELCVQRKRTLNAGGHDRSLRVIDRLAGMRRAMSPHRSGRPLQQSLRQERDQARETPARPRDSSSCRPSRSTLIQTGADQNAEMRRHGVVRDIASSRELAGRHRAGMGRKQVAEGGRRVGCASDPRRSMSGSSRPCVPEASVGQPMYLAIVTIS